LENIEDNKTESIANTYKMDFYKMFWIFFIGSFIGVIIETLWCYFTLNRVESRSGLIYGPFNLVYGFGALCITLGLIWLAKKNKILVFIGGAVIGSIFEYLCSYIQEKMFGTVSWEYTNMPFNISGRITLKFTIIWGILSVAWILYFCPMIFKILDKANKEIIRPVTWILLAFMIFNTVISAVAVDRMSKRHENVITNSLIERFLDNYYPDEYMQKIYPNMMYVK
jgi:uncharacterized membrane protein